MYNILHIDNSHIYKTTIKNSFAEYDVNYIEAKNEDNAYSILKNNNIDLIIYGVILQGDVSNFINKVYQMDNYRKVPIFIITGNDNVKDRIKIFQLGVTDYINKNTPTNKIAKYIMSYLENRKKESYFRKVKICVVDDSNFEIQNMKNFFSIIEKNDVDYYNSGEELFNSNKEYDLYIIDFFLKAGTSEEIVVKIRQKRKDVVIIIVSAISDDVNIVSNVLNLGANDYIFKPFSSHLFFARIRANLRSFYLLKERQELNERLNLINHRILKEINMAKTVQRGLLPNKEQLPDLIDFEIGLYYSTMEILGGDLYDIIKIDNDEYAFLITDVAGHGVPAALIASLAKSSFNNNTGKNISPAKVCENVNDEMCKFIGDSGYFLSTFYGILNIKSKEFTFTNAGHPNALLYNKNTKNITGLDTKGSIIGVINEVEFSTNSITLKKGDKILLFTDGVIETRNKNGNLYDYERLNEFIINNNQLETQEFVDELVENLKDFRENRSEEDDDTAILYINYV